MTAPPRPGHPAFLYGTAWKEDRTAALTELALREGFRGIDTANQRRHYVEAGVGQGLAAAYRAGLVARADLFLQTKFTYRDGQDHRLPYDPRADLSTRYRSATAGARPLASRCRNRFGNRMSIERNGLETRLGGDRPGSAAFTAARDPIESAADRG